MRSPWAMNSGTWIVAPVSSFAGFEPPAQEPTSQLSEAQACLRRTCRDWCENI